MGERLFPDHFLRHRADGDGTHPTGAAATPPARLAELPAIALGAVRLEPATRTLAGPDATVTLEPRAAQVLVELADADGAVVTRDQLAARCWAGQIVAEDSLNRVISLLRRAAREVGGGLAIVTISKVGYRLAVPLPNSQPAGSAARGSDAAGGWHRRHVAIGLAGLAAAASAGFLLSHRPAARTPAVQALLDRGRIALRDKLPDGTAQGIGFLQEAVGLAPDDAELWGLLAIAWCNVVEFAPAERIAAAVSACEEAIRRAVALQPDQPEAIAARALLPPTFGDWAAGERRLREVLRRYPDQLDALDGLGTLYFSAGLTRRAAAISERLVRLDPLSPEFSYRHAYRQWTMGDLGAADRTVDRALQLWPRHPAVVYARFLLFALTGRIDAAQQLQASSGGAAVLGDMQGWKRTLAALRSGKTTDRAKAVEANLDEARATMSSCTNAILALTRLDALDAAFDVANGYLLERGPMAGAIDRSAHLGAMNDQRWRKTMMLFIPASAPLRADHRFGPLCAGMGLVAFWRGSGTEPDCRCVA